MATFSAAVAAGADDGYITGTTISTAGVSIFFGNISGASHESFTRFTSVTIPQGSTVSAASIDFRADATRTSTTVNCTIYCNDEDDATAPTTRAGYLALALTTASGAWNNIPSTTNDVTYTTADFASAAEEVFARPAWASGNALMPLIKNNGSSTSAFRGADAFEQSGDFQPVLNITYTAAESSVPDLLLLGVGA